MSQEFQVQPGMAQRPAKRVPSHSFRFPADTYHILKHLIMGIWSNERLRDFDSPLQSGSSWSCYCYSFPFFPHHHYPSCGLLGWILCTVSITIERYSIYLSSFSLLLFISDLFLLLLACCSHGEVDLKTNSGGIFPTKNTGGSEQEQLNVTTR